MFQQFTEMLLAGARPIMEQQAILAGWTYYVIAFWFLAVQLGIFAFLVVSHKKDLDRAGRVSLATFKKAAWVMVPALMIAGFDLFVVVPANLTAGQKTAQVQPAGGEGEVALSLLEQEQE
ncbi:MAG: hypothetical protein KC519_19180 [Anaerolineae bacterium]|nr:hypothetical protein [Anaerolineae bacterium]